MLSVAALLMVLPRSCTCSLKDLHLRLNELGLHPDQLLDILGPNDSMGKFESRQNIMLREVHCLLADVQRADLTRLNSLSDGGNGFLSCSYIFVEGQLGLFNLRSATARISLGNSNFGDGTAITLLRCTDEAQSTHLGMGLVAESQVRSRRHIFQ